MRILSISLSVLLFAALAAAQSPYPSEFYIMADEDLDFDDFGISGGASPLPQFSMPQPQMSMPSTLPSQKGPLTLPLQTLPMQTSQSAPVTLPIQKSTRDLVNLPVINKQREPINAAPIVHTQYLEQPQIQYRLINQEFVQPRLIETPKLQQRVYSQPIYRQIVTQPVVVPRLTTQPIIHQRWVDQPIYQHRLIESSVVQPSMVDVPVTNAPRTAPVMELPAAEPIVQRENVQGNPIYRTAPTLTQPTVTQPIQMPPTPSKKSQAQYGVPLPSQLSASGLSNGGASGLQQPQMSGMEAEY